MKAINHDENSGNPEIMEMNETVLKQLITDNADRKHDLTIEEVKQMDSFKNMNECDIKELITVIKKFSTIVFNSLHGNKSKASVITMNNNNIRNKAA